MLKSDLYVELLKVYPHIIISIMVFTLLHKITLTLDVVFFFFFFLYYPKLKTKSLTGCEENPNKLYSVKLIVR